MKYVDNRVEDIKIAYVGGGSRGWAWGLMSDLAAAEDICGSVALYDIDYKAAEDNVIIGNKFGDAEGAKSRWNYYATKTLEEALTGANFVVISILPGTFKEMESDVHTPEKYGIYQSVGDTTGPGGIIRALRTIPMMQEIARGVEKCCPDAWVINYTNPMTVSVKALYETFPKIKAFGCCHEVFGTQWLLQTALKEYEGIEDTTRADINVNVVGVNHFTWLTKAQYKNIDLFPVFEKMARENYYTGYVKGKDTNWMNNFFESSDRVKFDLFLRFGYIAAAGDRHLAEFCPGDWYLQTPEKVREWGFGLTPVSFRIKNLADRLETSRKRVCGEEKIELTKTGEEGVEQIRALLGLQKLVTNVNIVNRGQMPNLPLGAVVEGNAVFSADSVTPVFAGDVPNEIHALISRIADEQELTVRAAINRDLEGAFRAFVNNPLVRLNTTDARKLFTEMVENTKTYLKEY